MIIVAKTKSKMALERFVYSTWSIFIIITEIILLYNVRFYDFLTSYGKRYQRTYFPAV